MSVPPGGARMNQRGEAVEAGSWSPRKEHLALRRELMKLMSVLHEQRENPMKPIRMKWVEIAPAAAAEIRRLRAAALSTTAGTEGGTDEG